MHVENLTDDYIHQDEPWYLSILCVRVTCKVHKSGKPGDNCTQVICHFSWKGGKYLPETILFGISPVSIDCWKRCGNTGPNSIANSFRTLGWSSSGPKALETTILSMKWADLSRSETWVCSFLPNTSVNWPLNSSAFSSSVCATPFPVLLFRDGIPWVSFSDCWYTDRSLWGLP